MRVILAGSRDLNSYSAMEKAISNARSEMGIVVTEVVCGMARGMDRVGKEWADLNGVPCTPMPADKTRWPYAGRERNEDMSVYGEALISVWDGKSPGTLDMIQRMHSKKKPYYTLLHQRRVK